MAKANSQHPTSLPRQDVPGVLGQVPRPARSPQDDVPGEPEPTEAGVLTPGAEAAAAHMDAVVRLREIVVGHRSALVAAGFDGDIADEMAAALHELLLPEFIT